MTKLLIICVLIALVAAAAQGAIFASCIPRNQRCYAMGIKCCDGLRCNRSSKNHGKCS
nr:venom polypeptide precursor [Doratifera vulnerans]